MTTATRHRYIVTDPAILGGEPIIEGTRTPVRAIVELWRHGLAPEDIPHRLPHLTLAQVFDALSYFSDHQEEIAAHILRNRIPVALIDPIVKKIDMIVNRLIITALLASFTLAVPKTTWADSTSDAKAAILAAYNDQNIGYLKLDDKAALSHTAPDFIGGDGKQVLRKPILVVGIQQLFLSIRKIHGHFERSTSIDRIEVNGSQATVLTKVHICGVACVANRKVLIHGVAFVDGDPNKPVATDYSGGPTKDIWLKTKDGWLQKSYTRLSGYAKLFGTE